MKRLLAIIRKADSILYAVAGGVLVAMVLVTLCDVILRNFGHPITGSMELIQYGGAIVFGFSIPFATLLKAQVQVDLITEKLSPSRQRAVAVVTRLVGIALFLFIAWNFYLYGLDVKKTGELSAGFKIPYYPIVFALGLSFLMQSLTIFLELVQLLRGEPEDPALGGEA